VNLYSVDEAKKSKLYPPSKIVVILFCLAIEMKEATSTIGNIALKAGSEKVRM